MSPLPQAQIHMLVLITQIYSMAVSPSVRLDMNGVSMSSCSLCHYENALLVSINNEGRQLCLSILIVVEILAGEVRSRLSKQNT